jgi:flavin reductase (DIM6/NTAB) family NADH-FMN oxidoreductase RutF
MDNGLGMMACISEDKLTRDRIEATGVFSANLVTEKTLALADYFGCTSGYDPDKMNINVRVENGRVLDVPILSDCPVAFELEVDKTINLDAGRVYLCKIRNVLVDSELCESDKPVEEKMRSIAPVCTTCNNYFSWNGDKIAKWGELADTVKKNKI